MTAVGATIDASAFERALKMSSPRKSPEIVRELLTQLALRNAAISASKHMKRGGKQPPVPGILTSRTGTGRRSIRVNLSGLPRVAETGSDLIYMAFHELNAKRPRPWLKPGQDEVLRIAPQLALSIWERHVG